MNHMPLAFDALYAMDVEQLAEIAVASEINNWIIHA